MSLHTSKNEDKDKYISANNNYAEASKRSKEEFAKGFIKSYDSALKTIMRRERGKDAMEFIKELKNEIAEEENQ